MRMRRLMASFPHPPGMTTEQVEAALRRLLDEPKREDPPHPDAPPPYAPAAFLLLPRNTCITDAPASHDASSDCYPLYLWNQVAKGRWCPLQLPTSLLQAWRQEQEHEASSNRGCLGCGFSSFLDARVFVHVIYVTTVPVWFFVFFFLFLGFGPLYATTLYSFFLGAMYAIFLLRDTKFVGRQVVTSSSSEAHGELKPVPCYLQSISHHFQNSACWSNYCFMCFILWFLLFFPKSKGSRNNKKNSTFFFLFGWPSRSSKKPCNNSIKTPSVVDPICG